MSQAMEIAVIPGDGVGKEVIPAGIRALEAAGKKHGVRYRWTEFDWSCETYHQTGRMMPEDGIGQLRSFDAIYLGAVGFPGVPDHVSLWGLLILATFILLFAAPLGYRETTTIGLHQGAHG